MKCSECKYWEKITANDDFDFYKSDRSWGMCDYASFNLDIDCKTKKSFAIFERDGASGQLMTTGDFYCSEYITKI